MFGAGPRSPSIVACVSSPSAIERWRRSSATEISRASASPERRRARMTAPTAAISSSSEATSKATR